MSQVVEMDKTVILPEELKSILCNDQSETTLCSDGRHMLYAGRLTSLGRTPVLICVNLDLLKVRMM